MFSFFAWNPLRDPHFTLHPKLQSTQIVVLSQHGRAPPLRVNHVITLFEQERLGLTADLQPAEGKGGADVNLRPV